MKMHVHQLRVRYGETDQMGIVYYGNYAQYLEVGRVEMLRELGYPYQQLEQSGILLPVLDLYIDYRLPAIYDEVLTVETRLVRFTGSRIGFEYVVRNEHSSVVCEAKTTLAFVDSTTRKPCRPPKELADELTALIQSMR
jgi:acyl-CoA thioester hydrolase